MKASAFRLCVLLATGALSTAAPVVGKFYVNVDDEVVLYVNGKEVFHSPGIGKAQSAETELAPGDRVTARLHNDAGPRYFMLLFVSSDKTRLMSFPHTAFKILPQPRGDRLFHR